MRAVGRAYHGDKMQKNSLLIAVPLIVLLSAAIAYGLVFCTPWFGARPDFGFSYSGTLGWG
jgi:hypothetical protein